MASNGDSFPWDAIIRPNILKLTPYRCARDDYSSGVLLDANENAFGHAIQRRDAASDQFGLDIDALQLNRYPDPSFANIKDRIARLRGLKSGAAGVFLGVGSDEVIDLLIRITCVPAKDSIMICPPTYGMYSVCASINDVSVVKVPLDVQDGKFQPRINAICDALSSQQPPPKLVFLTSPGNPTGTLIPVASLKPILEHPTWRGLLIVDEAYIDFASDPDADSAVQLLNKGYHNVVVLQTLSKGFGLAGIRLGMCMCDPDLAQFLANTKAPYNISSPTAALALEALSDESIKHAKATIQRALGNRKWLYDQLQSSRLQQLGVGKILGKQDANFLLVQILDKDRTAPNNDRAERLYTYLAERKGVVVRFRGREIGCEGCLRMTIGTDEECATLIDRLREALQEVQ